jgi:hypothetical protein
MSPRDGYSVIQHQERLVETRVRQPGEETPRCLVLPNRCAVQIQAELQSPAASQCDDPLFDASIELKSEKRIMSQIKLSDAVPAIRIEQANPDHHLWNNNGTWWIHYTLHLPDYTKRRVRRSLGTRRSNIARRRRDEIFADLLSQPASGLN